MSTDRVDKAWQSKGLDMYETPAILGTLNHYGVAIDEPGFKKLAEDGYPLGIARAWHTSWKGTGQFQRFPAAAAEELWHRLRPGEFAPTDLALAIINLLKEMDRLLTGKPDERTRETRFKVIEAYLAKLPPAGDRREQFLSELVVALNEWLDVFDRLAEALATKGHHAEADRFVAIEETLFPVREGSARALVKAAKGDRDGAAAELLAIARDVKRDDFARLSAVDGLLDLDRVDEAKAVTLELIDKAEQGKDVELAAEVVPRLRSVLEKNPKTPDRKALRDRVEKLATALQPGDDAALEPAGRRSRAAERK